MLLLLCLSAFVAGFIDSIAGGGGLIQLPVLFLLMPGVHPGASAATIFGTNKFSSVWGTLVATWRYSRRVTVAWSMVAPAALTAAVASYLGASVVNRIPLGAVRYLVLVLLIVIATYTFLSPDLGSVRRERFSGKLAVVAASVLGLVMGFYDGVFGPGTGSLLLFAFMALLGMDFLHASASAKTINLVTNLFALVFFLIHGTVDFAVAIPMALCNVGGSLLGTRLVIARGSRFVRLFILVVISAVILRFAYEVVAVGSLPA
jgi:uncharacterized membrane protein YfcA